MDERGLMGWDAAKAVHACHQRRTPSSHPPLVHPAGLPRRRWPIRLAIAHAPSLRAWLAREPAMNDPRNTVMTWRRRGGQADVTLLVMAGRMKRRCSGRPSPAKLCPTPLPER